MKKLTVDLPGREYDIVIENGLLAQAGAYIRTVCPRAKKLFVVTDTTVGPLYGQTLLDSLSEAGFHSFMTSVPAGESSKCAWQLAGLWENMMEFGLTRTDAVVALGGGVVGDLAGFAAATILRGVDFIQVPTTLLAQVDSSVGGKVAVDLEHGKNLAGCFWQPRLVLMDPNTLNTLSDGTFADGMAEVVKYGCIWDKPFFDLLSVRPTRIQLMADIEHILCTCCGIKRQVVMADERDTGARMVLNFGHTIGHAYELAGHYQAWTHGQAVAAGMVTAAKLGVSLNITPGALPGQLEDLLTKLNLPTAIPCSAADYAAAVGRDKKGTGSDISVILLDRIGHAVAQKMPKAELVRLLSSFHAVP